MRRDPLEIMERIIRMLEKEREIVDDLVRNLNILETTGLVSIGDVCSVLQRIEI